MKTIMMMSIFAVIPALSFGPASREKPAKPHPWLQAFVGEWEATTEELVSVPDGDPEAISVSETKRITVTEVMHAIGPHWVASEGSLSEESAENEVGVNLTTYLRTYGFDAETKEFVGTWVDSSSSYLWVYRGTFDPEGTKLTLETSGPGFDSEVAQYREVIELEGKDRRVHRNFIQNEKKQWVSFGEVMYSRKK